MPLEIRKKEKESSINLVRRFSKRMKMSGILLKIRRDRFYTRKKSRQMKKKSALKREALKKEYEKLKKLGKIENKPWQR